ncbi:esterase/lipase [Dysgonomonas sp. PFB1-18]|uniref:hypothetical protein n=1 Tax=unclassified Dysgonomonas TaxID=2630389 RepID=UPI00247685F2|nr:MULTISPECIES: hypothetical protein [unclassified Dysgonomonas]MDH6309799.1 esterase/lipase [Dysgonomonas sp. PF1-14]MDH6339193.1 esterase/lipase [Dysgonomonas sp. PF1-16]MDH6380692.1 esterase/lipase [Dysgonomonas sp. PFB1-18]MDH6398188.1 esterase/lipase [Dysgonomonas sp. PF1-23]
MNILEKNIRHLWIKADVDSGTESYLCLYSFSGSNIHVRITKDGVSGQYFVTCMYPRLVLHGFDLRQLLIVAFAELQSLTNDPYHRSTIKRVLGFFDTLKANPDLFAT